LRIPDGGLGGHEILARLLDLQHGRGFQLEQRLHAVGVALCQRGRRSESLQLRHGRPVFSAFLTHLVRMVPSKDLILSDDIADIDEDRPHKAIRSDADVPRAVGGACDAARRTQENRGIRRLDWLRLDVASRLLFG
jgi:hypothetical protein